MTSLFQKRARRADRIHRKGSKELDLIFTKGIKMEITDPEGGYKHQKILKSGLNYLSFIVRMKEKIIHPRVNKAISLKEVEKNSLIKRQEKNKKEALIMEQIRMEVK